MFQRWSELTKNWYKVDILALTLFDFKGVNLNSTPRSKTSNHILPAYLQAVAFFDV